jgi:hypothetical protein
MRHFEKTIGLLLVSSVALLAGQGLAAAQPAREIGTLRVTVLDPSGAAIPGAAVAVTDPAGTAHTGQADARGEALVSDLEPGTYVLRVHSPGFNPAEVVNLRVRRGSNRREVTLTIPKYAEEVTVTRSDADRQLADVFSNVLTQEQIDALPDDPDEMEAVLREMAGPGATLRVNGFRGGRLPPKSQIREIRFRMDPYAAENHGAGMHGVDIRTKPGTAGWRGTTSIGFRDESLNARNPLAPAKSAEQTRRYSWNLSGPIATNLSSLALSVDGTTAYDSRTIRAARPDGPFSSVFRQPTDRLNVTGRVEQALGKNHTMTAEFQRNATDLDSLGAGDFDLPERSYSRETRESVFRVADTGAIGKRAVNELRFQIRWQDSSSASLSDSPTISVVNAFTSGGAQVAGGRRAREIEVADNLDFSAGRHAFRAGVLLESGWYRGDERRNWNGTFTFSSLEAYAGGRPLTFSQRVGDPLVEFSQHQFAWYVQDDIRVTKTLLVSAGLRHEVQSHLGDWNNLAPRAGLTWSPFKRSPTTFRFGAGVFYDWYESSVYEQTLRVDGQRQRDIVIRNPGFPDPYAAGDRQELPASRIQAAPGLDMPRVARYSLGVEHRVGPARLTFNLFDQRGANTLRSRNINAPIGGVRPDPGAGNILQIESTGRTRSRGTDFGVNFMNPARGQFASVRYVLSSSRSEADGALDLPADSIGLAGEWGPTPSDARHRLFTLVNTPLFWRLRLASVFRAQSGTPYDVTTGFDDNGDTIVNDRPAGVSRNSARGRGQVNLDARLSWSRGFGRRVEQTAGGTPRVIAIRPGDDALSMMPGANNAESRWSLELYVQAYNLLNAANYLTYSGVLTSPFYGQPIAAQPGRRVESGIRVGF